MITASGGIKLADFGVSAQLSPTKPACTTLIGTRKSNNKKKHPFFSVLTFLFLAYWMAPEVINMEPTLPYDYRVKSRPLFL